MPHIQKRHDVAGSKLFEGDNSIYALREILSDILNDLPLPKYLLVDALDEYVTRLADLLHIITDYNLTQRSNIKWLVTSRNLLEIERFLYPNTSRININLELYSSYVSRAVKAFISLKVNYLATRQKYDSNTSREVQELLQEKVEGTFLWISLVCKELETVPLYRTRSVLREIPPGLNPLYDRMMEQILTQNDPQTVQFCQRLLRAVALTYRPLRLRELIVTSSLPGDKFGDIHGIFDLVNRCSSFLSIREDTVFFVHLSAYDYFTLGRGKQVFNGTTMVEHEKITYRLLHSMCHTLRRDICSLKEPGVRIQEARKCISGTALSHIAYACEY